MFTRLLTFDLKTAIVGLGFVLCWSSGYVGGVLATDATLPVLSLFAWRFLLATAIMASVVVLFRAKVGMRKPMGTRQLGRELVVGLFTMGGFLLGVMLALELGVSAGLTALIAALQPLVAAALAGRWLGERLPARGWLGMGVATVGVLLCVVDDLNGNTTGTPLWAYGLPVLSVLSVTTGSVLSARWNTALPIPAALGMQLLGATGVFALAAMLLEPGGLTLPSPAAIVALTANDLAALGWLIVLSSFGGYGFFVASLRRMGVTRTSTLVYLTPPVTLVWAGLMFGDWPGLVALGGMALAGVGVALAMGVASTSRHNEVVDANAWTKPQPAAWQQ